jgi:hypothetical protein
METIKDFFKNILQSGSERMNSPIIGTYFISFVIYNWRAILVILFSNLSIENRIEIINGAYCCADAIIVPIYMTAVYIIVLPHVQLSLDFLLGFSQKLSHNISQSRKRILLKGKVEEASLEREIADSRAGTSEISSLKIQVDLLKEQNDDLLKKSNADLQSFNNQTAELTSQQTAALSIIDNLRKEVKSYKDSFDKLNNNPAYIELPQETIEMLRNFNLQEQEEFIQMIRVNFENEIDYIDLISKSQKFGIIYRNNSGDLALTQFGKIAYKYFADNIFPF